jgi:hypothetical protein
MQTAPDVEALADSIRKISKCMQEMLDSGLTRKALIVLIHHATSPKVGMKTIGQVLDAIERLEDENIESDDVSS